MPNTQNSLYEKKLLLKDNNGYQKNKLQDLHYKKINNLK